MPVSQLLSRGQDRTTISRVGGRPDPIEKGRIDVNTAREWRWLLPVMAMMGLASCSDRMPSQPRVATVGPAPSGGTPSDSTVEANRAIWSAAGIDAYRYRFRWECYCLYERVRTVDITVVKGTIVSVVDAETREPVGGWAATQYRTIDGLFDFVRESIDYPAASIRAAFDSGLGYPSMAYVDYVAAAVDEELGFRVYSLDRIQRR